MWSGKTHDSLSMETKKLLTHKCKYNLQTPRPAAGGDTCGVEKPMTHSLGANDYHCFHLMETELTMGDVSRGRQSLPAHVEARDKNIPEALPAPINSSPSTSSSVPHQSQPS